MTGVLLAIFVGGGMGSLARFGISRWLGASESGFPVGTLAANFVASLILGFVAAYVLRKAALSPAMQAGIMTGFCGGFSTFSTFSLETFGLFSEGKSLVAFAYVATSVVICLGGIFLGNYLAKFAG